MIFPTVNCLTILSDFLKPQHFFESLHARMYAVISDLVHMGKLANPVTLKSFIPSDEKIGDITVFNYTMRLSAEAITVINAADYGHLMMHLLILFHANRSKMLSNVCFNLLKPASTMVVLKILANPWIKLSVWQV